MCTWVSQSPLSDSYTQEKQEIHWNIRGSFLFSGRKSEFALFLFQGERYVHRNSQLSCCGWHSRFNWGHRSFMPGDWGWALETLACTSLHILSPTWSIEGSPRQTVPISKITGSFSCKTAAEAQLASTLSKCHPESHRFGTKWCYFGISKGIPR